MSQMSSQIHKLIDYEDKISVYKPVNSNSDRKPFDFGSNKQKAKRKTRKQEIKRERREARNSGISYQEIGNH